MELRGGILVDICRILIVSGISRYRGQNPSLVRGLTRGIDMHKMDGLELLQRTKAIVPDTAVVIITGYASVDSAVRAMKHGAYDYIEKPVTSDRIKDVIQNAITRAPVEASAASEHTPPPETPDPREG